MIPTPTPFYLTATSTIIVHASSLSGAKSASARPVVSKKDNSARKSDSACALTDPACEKFTLTDSWGKQ